MKQAEARMGRGRWGQSREGLRQGGSDASAARMRGPLLALGRAAWLIVAAMAAITLVMALPGFYAGLERLAPAGGGDLNRIGLSASAYTAACAAFALLFVACHIGVAGLIFLRKSDEPMALLVSLFLLAFAVSTPVSGLGPENLPAALNLLANLLSLFAWIPLNAFFYLFPDGRLVPAWGWLPLVVVVAVIGLGNLPGSSPLSFDRFPGWLQACFYCGLWGIAIYAQVYRYRHVSGPVQRQQTKWAVYGFVTSTALTTLFSLPGLLQPALAAPGTLYSLAQEPVNVVLRLLIPLSLGVAVMRHRLWDIDPIINRTLVYAALTAMVAGAYVAIAWGAGLLLEDRGNLFVSLLATVLIALLFQPLRERTQRAVNRLMYGERDDPYAVLTRLGRQLEMALAPDTVLPSVLETVAGSLRLPYAAIWVRTAEGNWARAAVYRSEDWRLQIADFSESPISNLQAPSSEEPPGSASLPLVYQKETIGRLVLAPRADGDAFSTADRRLFEDLARQIGVAAHAVRLTSDLQRSRERLVAAREEERRRLRRDLHDGLGPTLAALALAAGNVYDVIPENPEGGRALAAKLETGLREAIGDIRRLVYGLRPPTLDELGLVAAVRERAAQVSRAQQAGDRGPAGLQVSVEAPERLAGLPAAVEVAAYRIAEEALTNVVRHAGAKTCAIRFALADRDRTLEVEIADDGRGLPAERSAGVGLLSMRERAAELGGTCTVESTGRGTRVIARLPLAAH